MILIPHELQLLSFPLIMSNAQTIHPQSHYSRFHNTLHPTAQTFNIRHETPLVLPVILNDLSGLRWIPFRLFIKALRFHSETAARRPRGRPDSGDSHCCFFFFFLSPAHSAVIFLDSVRLAIFLKCSGFLQSQPPCWGTMWMIQKLLLLFFRGLDEHFVRANKTYLSMHK